MLFRNGDLVPSLAVRVAAAAFACVLCAAPAGAQDEWRWSDVPRVVAFGDVHGAYAELVALLRATGLGGPDLHWAAGGTTHAVSLGDLLDRGPSERAVIELTMRLQDEARAAGGGFHVVLGNHEVMNLVGDLRYVAPDGYAAFAADETPAVRAAAYAEYAERARAPSAAAFDREHPPGYFARVAAFRADGRYGAWLLTLPSIVVINDAALMHGGPSQLVAATAASS